MQKLPLQTSFFKFLLICAPRSEVNMFKSKIFRFQIKRKIADLFTITETSYRKLNDPTLRVPVQSDLFFIIHFKTTLLSKVEDKLNEPDNSN